MLYNITKYVYIVEYGELAPERGDGDLENELLSGFI